MTVTTETGYLESILRPLLSAPEELSIERTADDRGILLTIKVAKQDMGRVIGKQGNTARSIRTLLRIFGMNINAHISMKLYDPENRFAEQPE